jgi:heme-degrading monooxygenase HmoA
MAPAEPFISLVFYPSTAPAQAGQADTLLRMVEATIRREPGFLGGRVFLSEDGDSVVTLVEWQDREAFVNFRQTEFGRMATQVAGELHPTAYWLRPYAVVSP